MEETPVAKRALGQTEVFRPVTTALPEDSGNYDPSTWAQLGREPLTPPQVVGLSVGAAALVGGLYLALEPPPEPPLPRSVERVIRQLPRAQRKQARHAALQAGQAVAEVQQHAAETAGNLSERLTSAKDLLRQQLAGAAIVAGNRLASSGDRLAKPPARKLAMPWPFRRKRASAIERGRERVGKVVREAGQQVDTVAQQARATLGTAVEATGDSLTSFANVVSKFGHDKEASAVRQLHKTIDDAGAKTSKLSKRGRKEMERQLNALEQQRRAVAKRARKGTAGLRQRGRGWASVLPSRKASRPRVSFAKAGDAFEQARMSTVASISPLLERARDSGVGPRLRENAAQALDVATKRAAELGQHVRDDLVPRALDLAHQAGAQATGAATSGVEAGRAKLHDLAASDVAEHAAQLVSRAGDQAGQLTAQATQQAEHLAERASELATRAGRSGHEAVDEARRAAQRTRRAAAASGATARRAGGKALSATGGAFKDLTLGLAWLGALGAAVYFGFLNAEQRAKVATTAKSLYGQAQELVRDFQGYDEEF